MSLTTIASLAEPGGFHDGDWVESKDQDPSGDIRLLQLADIGDGYFRNRSDRWINQDTFRRLACSWVRPGDILIARMPDPIGRSCLVPPRLGSTITVVDVAVLRCNEQVVDRRYATYALNSHFTRSLIGSLQDGSTRQRIPRKRLGRVPVPIHGLDTQRAIADFLDCETAQIDTLIAKQEQLIRILQERGSRSREAMLGPRVGSGHRLKWYIREVDIRAGSAAVQLALMSVSISWGVRPRNEVTNDQAKALDLSNYKICEPGDIVLNRMRAFQGALGVAPMRGIVSPDYAVLRTSRSISAEWLAMVMRTQRFVGEMVLRLKGIGGTEGGSVRTPRINIDDLAEILIDVPAANEQASTVASIASDTDELRTVVAKAEQLVALAKERRAALITAAVTGQIDVIKAA